MAVAGVSSPRHELAYIRTHHVYYVYHSFLPKIDYHDYSQCDRKWSTTFVGYSVEQKVNRPELVQSVVGGRKRAAAWLTRSAAITFRADWSREGGRGGGGRGWGDDEDFEKEVLHLSVVAEGVN